MSDQKSAAREQAEALFKKPAKSTTDADAAAQSVTDGRERQKAARLASEDQKPTKLRLFAEQLSDGSVGRRAFVTIAAKMPAPADGAKWLEQIDFNAADATRQYRALIKLFSSLILGRAATPSKSALFWSLAAHQQPASPSTSGSTIR